MATEQKNENIPPTDQDAAAAAAAKKAKNEAKNEEKRRAKMAKFEAKKAKVTKTDLPDCWIH